VLDLVEDALQPVTVLLAMVYTLFVTVVLPETVLLLPRL
jgi:hypothetical protein